MSIKKDGINEANEAFIATIKRLPLIDQNRLLKMRIEYIEMLNKKEMEEMQNGLKQTSEQSQTSVTIDAHEMPMDQIRKAHEKEVSDLKRHCKTKMDEAKISAEVFVNYYNDAKNANIQELNDRYRRIKSLQESALAQLKSQDEAYEMKIAAFERHVRTIRAENYFFFQLMCDEMHRRMGHDAGKSKVYSNHMLQKKMLERNIIRHNQELMSTEEGKSSTSSSSTASIVESLKRDVDRLERVIDMFCEKKNNDMGLFSEIDEDELSSCDSMISKPSFESSYTPSYDIADIAKKFVKIDASKFYMSLDVSQGDKQDKKTEKQIDNENTTLDEIVDGKELELSDFSI